jgi:hypothetical protein
MYNIHTAYDIIGPETDEAEVTRVYRVAIFWLHQTRSRY